MSRREFLAGFYGATTGERVDFSRDGGAAYIEANGGTLVASRCAVDGGEIVTYQFRGTDRDALLTWGQFGNGRWMLV